MTEYLNSDFAQSSLRHTFPSEPRTGNTIELLLETVDRVVSDEPAPAAVNFIEVEPPQETFPIAKLSVPVEWMRFCAACNSERCFIAERICVSGLIGKCSHCGDERIAPYTRTTTEAA